MASVSSAGAEIIGVGERFMSKHSAPEPVVSMQPLFVLEMMAATPNVSGGINRGCQTWGIYRVILESQLWYSEPSTLVIDHFELQTFGFKKRTHYWMSSSTFLLIFNGRCLFIVRLFLKNFCDLNKESPKVWHALYNIKPDRIRPGSGYHIPPAIQKSTI